MILRSKKIVKLLTFKTLLALHLNIPLELRLHLALKEKIHRCIHVVELCTFCILIYISHGAYLFPLSHTNLKTFPAQDWMNIIFVCMDELDSDCGTLHGLIINNIP